MSSGPKGARKGVAIITACAGMVLGIWSGVASGSQPVRTDGVYRIVSTDCYFSAGSCHARFDIEQAGNILSDRSDKLLHGRINGTHVRIGETYPPGTSEDGWIAIGTTTDGGKTVKGTFTDGIGGSGTFTMTYVAP